jgi:hypothetical protein
MTINDDKRSERTGAAVTPVQRVDWRSERTGVTGLGLVHTGLDHQWTGEWTGDWATSGLRQSTQSRAHVPSHRVPDASGTYPRIGTYPRTAVDPVAGLATDPVARRVAVSSPRAPHRALPTRREQPPHAARVATVPAAPHDGSRPGRGPPAGDVGAVARAAAGAVDGKASQKGTRGGLPREARPAAALLLHPTRLPAARPGALARPRVCS